MELGTWNLEWKFFKNELILSGSSDVCIEHSIRSNSLTAAPQSLLNILHANYAEATSCMNTMLNPSQWNLELGTWEGNSGNAQRLN